MTNTDPTHVLLVEDNPSDARLIAEYFKEQTWPEIEESEPEITHVERLSAAVDACDDTVDIVLLDLGLPDSSGLETLDTMVEGASAVPVVVLTGLDDERVGIDAVEHGAQDYLVKDDITPNLLQRTLRYAIERERQQRQLSQRNEELALLNQIVRHDIKNDVAIILGWGEGLEDHVDPTGEEYLEHIMSAGNHITDIAETVGDFLDVLEGNSDPDLRPIDIERVLTNEIEKARSAHDSVTVRLADEIPSGLRVAATELVSSLFRNLLNNAVTHNDKETPEITVSVDVHDETVQFHVADNGPGVPDSQKQEVFGRGEMGLESPGTGIGLYLVDTLAEMYDGSVTLSDNDPEGSVFTVTLSQW
ncbi:hybrid sensor histidine kinase/response regulator [Halorientalis salina]|uniref:hybrid sensor histidine kinase/response regulator n=1 Tax=Halorientalis salina TaxID=2932266 RepID=UPI0010AB574D|nr:hybrid sensor histidine kinase/response regulator [Halorientalis salina]